MNTQDIFDALAGTYCCYNDQNLSFEKSGTNLTSLAGYTSEDIQTEGLNQLKHLIVSESRDIICQTLQTSLSEDTYTELLFQIRHKNGDILWVLNRSKKVIDEEGNTYICGLLTDISNMKLSFDQTHRDLQKRAEEDPLTKLLNNCTARKQAEEYLNAFPSGAHCALLILDLDNFKQINDRYGHMYGDQILVSTAQEIKQLFRADDIISRIGGDEFMVLMKDVDDQTIVKERCQMLLQSICTLQINVPDFCGVSISIGIAFSPIHGISYDELFKHADQALYRAKEYGKKCYSIYDVNAD